MRVESVNIKSLNLTISTRGLDNRAEQKAEEKSCWNCTHFKVWLKKAEGKLHETA